MERGGLAAFSRAPPSTPGTAAAHACAAAAVLTLLRTYPVGLSCTALPDRRAYARLGASWAQYLDRSAAAGMVGAGGGVGASAGAQAAYLEDLSDEDEDSADFGAAYLDAPRAASSPSATGGEPAYFHHRHTSATARAFWLGVDDGEGLSAHMQLRRLAGRGCAVEEKAAAVWA